MVCVMMSPQVLLDWRRVKSNKRAGVNRGEGHMKGLQTGHKGILCAPQNKQTFSWHTVCGLVFFPFLFQIRKLGLYCNSVSTSLHVETIQRMFDQSPLETACLLPKRKRNKQRKKKTLAYFLNMLNQQTRKLMTKQKSCFDFSCGTDRLLRKRVVGKCTCTRRHWDYSRLTDPAHLLLMSETLAVHLRVSGNRGPFGIVMMMPRREKQKDRSSLTSRGREGLLGSTVMVRTVGCNWRWLCLCLCYAPFPGLSRPLGQSLIS